MKSSVDLLYDDYIALKSLLESTKEVSLLSSYTNTFRKVLILSCGSYFEEQVTKILKKYAYKCSSGDDKLVNFIYNQAIAGKYHTLFDWGKQNDPDSPKKTANRFYSLFGVEFAEEVKTELKSETTRFGNKSECINQAITAFLELGHLRNILVHNNFAEYSYNQKTPEDIYNLYKDAIFFVAYIKDILLGNNRIIPLGCE